MVDEKQIAKNESPETEEWEKEKGSIHPQAANSVLTEVDTMPKTVHTRLSPISECKKVEKVWTADKDPKTTLSKVKRIESKRASGISKDDFKAKQIKGDKANSKLKQIKKQREKKHTDASIVKGGIPDIEILIV